MKIAFYCQNVLGLGHITRSRAILRELCNGHEVTFIQGGQDSGLEMNFPHLELFSLPPIMMKEADGSLYVPDASVDIEAQWERRKQKALQLKDRFFDVALIELYPFGRRQFRKEIELLLENFRRQNPRIKIYCSLRDIMIQKLSEPARVEKILEALKNFDGVLVHSDSKLIPLELTWPAAEKIRKKLIYTGFVTEPSRIDSRTSASARTNEILVSAGGGNVGEDFYSAILKSTDQFAEYQFTFVIGPYAKPEFRNIFTAQASTKKNVKIVGLIANFEERLLSCRLSISLAGYNTVMNILNTHTPALFFPYAANWEQKSRLSIFEKEGKLLVLNSLSEESVVTRITDALRFHPTESFVNLAGAKNTNEFLENALAKKKKFLFF
jgi:predicted glycosyltransferase